MNRLEVGQNAAIEPRRRQAGEFRLVEMNAMPEQRARPEQAVAVVDVGVARGLRIKPARGRDLLVILGQMGLQVAVGMLAQQCAGRLELCLGRGQGEARCDRVVLPAPPVPVADQRLGLVVAPLGSVEQPCRRAAVHHHLAGDHPRVAAVAFGEERLGGFGSDGAIDDRRGRAVAEQLVEEEPGHPPGMGGIGELLLLDEGILLQPFQELLAVGADHLRLRENGCGCRSGRAGRADPDSERPACLPAGAGEDPPPRPPRRWSRLRSRRRRPSSSDGWLALRPRPGRR